MTILGGIGLVLVIAAIMAAFAYIWHVAPELACPNCFSLNVEHHGEPWPNGYNRCYDCHHEWREV